MGLKEYIREWLEIEPVDLEPLRKRVSDLSADLGQLRMKVEQLEMEAERIFPVRVVPYVGNDDQEGVIDAEGYVRSGLLTVWFSCDKDAIGPLNGELRFEPQGIDHLFRYGGVGPQMGGFARAWRPDGTVHAQGTVKWHGKRVAFCFYTGIRGKEAGGEFMISGSDLRPDGIAWPFRKTYGIVGSFTIPIP